MRILHVVRPVLKPGMRVCVKMSLRGVPWAEPALDLIGGGNLKKRDYHAHCRVLVNDKRESGYLPDFESGRASYCLMGVNDCEVV